MVKTIVSILLSFCLIVGATCAESACLKAQFGEFCTVVETLRDKTENETATAEDGKAVRTVWEEKKKILHILVQHTSISYVDYWLNEAIGLIYVGQYADALPKIDVVLDICRNLPADYLLSLGNVL